MRYRAIFCDLGNAGEAASVHCGMLAKTRPSGSTVTPLIAASGTLATISSSSATGVVTGWMAVAARATA
ncbi:MAG: hypothetical protein AAF183_22360 [Pseudomonadota bacterium]